MGEFEVSAKAAGYRRKPPIGEWQFVPYSVGNAPEIEIIVSGRGTQEPYFIIGR